MIPDVPRVPSDPALRGQVLELYRVLAAMRDYIEYQFNVIEDRFGDIENGGAANESVMRALQNINEEIRRIKSKSSGGLRIDALAYFDYGAWSRNVTYTSTAVGSLTE